MSLTSVVNTETVELTSPGDCQLQNKRAFPFTVLCLDFIFIVINPAK